MCYEFAHGKVVKGLSVSSDVKHGQVIFLGVANDRSRPTKVGLDKYNSPKVQQGKILEAETRNINAKSGAKFRVLQRPMRPSMTGEALVRICTSGSGNQNSNGSYRVLAGAPTGLFQADGINRTTRFSDDIIAMNVGDKVGVTMEGDDKEVVLENVGGEIRLVEQA